MTKILINALLLGAVTISQVAAQNCYALAFSSGDMSSAYQVGALAGLIENLSAEEVAYSSVSGVSGGALNAALFASFPVG
jgi:predicted acylesterase/phospholipase RssA